MVSKKNIKDYDFTTTEEYFDYIVASKTNGQHQQVEDLITKLSKQQKKDFLEHVNNNPHAGEDSRYCTDLTLKLL